MAECYFSCKDQSLKSLQSHVDSEFKCAGCKSSCIGKMRRHWRTKIVQNLDKDKITRWSQFTGKYPGECKYWLL